MTVGYSCDGGEKERCASVVATAAAAAAVVKVLVFDFLSDAKLRHPPDSIS